MNSVVKEIKNSSLSIVMGKYRKLVRGSSTSESENSNLTELLCKGPSTMLAQLTADDKNTTNTCRKSPSFDSDLSGSGGFDEVINVAEEMNVSGGGSRKRARTLSYFAYLGDRAMPVPSNIEYTVCPEPSQGNKRIRVTKGQ